MKRITLCSFTILVIIVLTLSPGNDCGRRRKILMAKKLAALLLLNKKRYIFVAPFPLPFPLPVITKVKHIVHKEKIPVPVPVPHPVTKYVAVPVPVPEKSWSDESWKTPEPYASGSEVSYKISEKPRSPKHLEKIYSESRHNFKFSEKPSYSEEPIKISEKPYLDGTYKLPVDKTYHIVESGKLPERFYPEESVKFEHSLKNYETDDDISSAASSIHSEEAIKIPKKMKNRYTHGHEGQILHHLNEESSHEFNENSYSDEFLAKLSGEMTSSRIKPTSNEYLSEASELSADNYPMLQESSLMIKKKK